MKLTINSHALSKALQVVAPAVGKNPVLPILEHILMRTTDEGVELIGTDLEVFIRATVPCKVIIAGSITIPAKLVLDMVKKLPNQELMFNFNGKTIITSAFGNYEVLSGECDDFPKFKEIEHAKTTKLPSSVFIEGIAATLFTASSDDLRPAMCGVYFESDGTSTAMVATDAHVLARYSFPSDLESSVIIPRKALNLIKSSFKTDGDVIVAYSATHATIEQDRITIIARLIDARFPDYKQIIPSGYTNKATVNKKSLVNCLKRVMLFANSRSSQVLFSYTEGGLKVRSFDSDFENAGAETFECDHNLEDNFEIGFNGRFVITALNNTYGRDIEIYFGANNRPAIIYSEGGKQEILIMPMMLES